MTNQDKAEICELFRSGLTITEIAKRYGKALQTISSIIDKCYLPYRGDNKICIAIHQDQYFFTEKELIDNASYNLEYLRKKHNLSYKCLGNKLGVSRGVMYWLRFKGLMPYSILESICEKFNINEVDFLTKRLDEI